MNNWR